MIRVGVIGVGHLGQTHARLYQELADAELIGVADVNAKRAEKVAGLQGCEAFTDFESLLPKVQAVSVVVPTPLHERIGLACLRAGVHCLIEKPLATTVHEAERLHNLAESRRVILQVGHVERFNPAVQEAQRYITDPRFIQAVRLGPYDPRVSHVGVVLDLMIHDLDIILDLVRAPVVELQAVGVRIFSEHEDVANARLTFSNNCVADVSASRVSLRPLRTIRVFQSDGCVSLDYMEQELRIYRAKVGSNGAAQEIEALQPKLEKGEPLRAELQHFLDCIREGQRPLVGGEHGRDALALAMEILEQVKLARAV